MDYYIIATAADVEFSGVVYFRVRPKDDNRERHCKTNDIEEQTSFLGDGTKELCSQASSRVSYIGTLIAGKQLQDGCSHTNYQGCVMLSH